jgi:prephenate dehydrogenase
MNKTIGIIGFGRFGQLWKKILDDDFDIKVYDSQSSLSTDPLDLVLAQEILFLCVPIRSFEKIIQAIATRIKPNTTVFDVCSVKVYTTGLMKTYLPSTVKIIATHPMFGPDSYNTDADLRIMMHSTRCDEDSFKQWASYFTRKKFSVLEMTPDQHDQFAAKSQGITHFIGRTLHAMKASPTPIDTKGYSGLLEVMQQTCNDSWELFMDLQQYNPYSSSVIEAFDTAVNNIKKEIKDE